MMGSPGHGVRLAPPGAGLPWPERRVARLRFGFVRRKWSAAEIDARFARERARIAELVASCDEASASRRVLVPRLLGLEDSSRDGSLWMAS